jgi:transposase
VGLRLRADVTPKTSGPRIKTLSGPGRGVATDADAHSARRPEGGSTPRTVCPAAGEFARDEDGAGFGTVPVNPIAGFWSRRWSWLRPHRGISPEKRPLDLGFFEFVPNVRRRGKARLGALIGLLLRPSSRNTG